ncbi:MAG: protein-L-isoaspartate(D-aspartate) O-methyltransferase [Bacteroidales bacterium]|nr:protein-L-isoaspartate(D-aspartate) O-methyltransferase [Bacteroidales bacterium]
MKKLFKLILFLMVSVIFGQCNSQESSKDQYATQREDMVRYQIKARGVKDKKVLDAMLKVERHLFVPPEYISQAYEDHPLPVGEGQTISQPYIVALMTEVLDPDSTKRVLEIGTGSGYQAAVLAEICDSVYTIEIFESLGTKAKNLLKVLDYDNVKVKIGDGYKGWEEHSPFDAIIVTCAPTHIPQPLKDQLTEGGKMIIPVGESYAQELVLLEKKNGRIVQKDIIAVRFVPMINGKGKKY